MSLDFLTVSAPAGGPPAESPMTAAAERDGGRCEIRDGWRVAVAFAGDLEERRAAAETVAFADASALAKTELQGPAQLLAGCAGGLTSGTASAHAGAWWLPITATRALVVGAVPADADVEGLHAVDVTGQFCALRIEGPLARPLMARFCALDLRPAVCPPLAVLPGSVARTPGLVLVEAPDRLLVLAGAAVAEHLWTVVADAAARLGGGPAGVDVLDSVLEGTAHGA